jgi:hypothetical protein
LNNNGNSIGQTDSSGKLVYTFVNSDTYWLVTFKAGYLPAYSRLAVKEPSQALAIKSPRTAAPGQTVTFTVHLVGTTTPVSDAAVWLVTADNAAALQARIAEIKAANQGNLQNVDWESVLNIQANKLNRTNASGQTTGSFSNGGIYLVITLKKGYIPGYNYMTVFAATTQPPTAVSPTPTGTTR